MLVATKMASENGGIALKPGVNFQQRDGLKVHISPAAISSSDAKEFVSRDRYEKSIGRKSPERLFFEDVLRKSDFIRTFQVISGLIDVSDGQTVLELGASHSWASVLVKCDFPGSYVVTSDLIPDCLRYAFVYERVLATSVNEKWAFNVRDIPFADAQFDRIFTFAAFHHFSNRGDYSQPMREIARILKPGGKLILLYEPTAPRLLYRSAYQRVNRKRREEGVDEDVLVVRNLRRIAKTFALSLEAKPFPIFQYRCSIGSTMYYYLLAKLGLGKVMVCTANIVMEKHRQSI
jgi:SAM-dependent methyltransferase